MSQMWAIDRSPCLQHHGIKGMKWGVWNAETRARYSGRDRVFISGKVNFDKQLPKKVKDEINQVMKASAQIIVGDAPGADTRVQDYLAKSGYSNVTVFTSEGKARNNVGNWKERNIGKKLENERARRAQKDIAMTNLATKAIAIMPKDDRPDSAMSKNIERLSNNNVKTTLYDFSDDTMNVKLGNVFKERAMSAAKTKKDIDSLYNTLSKNDKKLLGDDSNSREWLKLEEGEYVVKRFLKKEKGVPIAALDIMTTTKKGHLTAAIMTDPKYRGYGYATKLAKKGVDWYDKNKDRFGTVSLGWGAYQSNKASIAIAQKVGFKYNKKKSNDEWAVLDYK